VIAVAIRPHADQIAPGHDIASRMPHEDHNRGREQRRISEGRSLRFWWGVASVADVTVEATAAIVPPRLFPAATTLSHPGRKPKRRWLGLPE
jgi:hypothetical protein